MKGLVLMSVVILALGFLPAVSPAVGIGNQKVHNSMAGEYRSSKSGETPFEYQASGVIGTIVKNKGGDYLGRITDLMIDPQNGGIPFGVLSRGGVLGIPMRFVAVPFSALTPIKENHAYLLDISEERMAAAPSFDRHHWPDVANRGWEIDTDRYYGVSPSWGDSDKPIAKPAAQNSSKAYDFNKIVGTPVKNLQGEELGKMHDVVINFHGHVPFAVLSHGGFWGIGGRLVAVPYRSLYFDQVGKDFILNYSEEKLDSASAFKASDISKKNWPEEVYRYFGQQPYWKG
jgi:sporulation protein YlmC with PRC-barrel domain